MSVALDVGTSRLRSLRRVGNELVGRSVAAGFGLVPDGPAARDLLTRSGLPFAAGDGELALVGEAAGDAAAFQAVPLRLMAGGLVPDDDPPARQILGTLVEALLPAPAAAGEPCAVVLPAAAVEDHASRDFLTRLLKLRGYEPFVVSAGHAVALATLGGEAFSGIAVSFGAGGCAMSLVHRGRELASSAEPRGTDWIDAHIAGVEGRCAYDAAGARSLDTESVRRQRENLSDPLTRPGSPFAESVTRLTADVLSAAAKGLAREIADGRLGPFSAPLPVVCAGGGVRPAGFATLLQQSLAAALSSVSSSPAPGPARLAPPDDYLVARGALIAAALEATAAAA